ncbi:MAG: hypothetical protein HYX79_10565 [Chloroflexi bacterium]|nr:hypothetical protein [Chloroflexota bacterium]
MYKVVWPGGKKVVGTASFARRLDTLEGKTIGELWDYVFRGDEVFPALEKALSKRYPGIKFVGYKTFGNIHGGNEAKVIADLPDHLRKNGCDAVISSMGC